MPKSDPETLSILLSELAALKAEVVHLKANQPSPPVQPLQTGMTSTRRNLLKRLAGAAAVGFMAASVGHEAPFVKAGSGTGATLQIDTQNSSGNSALSTILESPSSGFPVTYTMSGNLFRVNNRGGTGGAPTIVGGNVAITGYTFGQASGIKVGVHGETDIGTPDNIYSYGVEGVSDGYSSAGVYGYSRNNGVGVQGYSPVGSGYGGLFTGNRAPLRLTSNSYAGVPTSRSIYHYPGEFWVDNTGAVYYCTTEGTESIPNLANWRKLAGPTSAGTLHLLSTPYRAVNTMDGTDLNNFKGALEPFADVSGVGSVRQNFVGSGGSSGVPSNALAITGHLHVHPGTESLKLKPGFGYLTAWQQGRPYPTATPTRGIATVYFLRGAVASSQFTVALSAAGQFSVASDTYTHLLVDITGYYL
jgi:hypothetical protein